VPGEYVTNVSQAVRGAIPSPNIWNSPDIYEVYNRAVDPDGLIESAMTEIRPWDGAAVLDVGCGTGFHLPRFAARARTVVGVEPHRGLAVRARDRVAGLPNASVRNAGAQELPLPPASVDVAHARWAYFFGPGCEPGLAELARVMRKGGAAFVVDIDAARGTYGRWFRRHFPRYEPDDVERFWSGRGFSRRRVEMRLAFESRADLAAVLAIEFPADLAAEFTAEHAGLEIDYPVNVRWKYY
jgi:SAM-dependent methyltransferase